MAYLYSKMLTNISRFTKLTVLTFVVVFGALSTILLVGAQEQVEIEEIGLGVTQEIANPSLNIKTTAQPVQEYPSKKFAVVLTIDSAINSNRVSVKWNIDNAYFVAINGNDDLVQVRTGEKTTLVKYFQPNPAVIGINNKYKKAEIGVRVNSFVDDINYLSSTRSILEFNNEYELLPISSEYNNSKLLQTGLRWAIIVLVVGAVITAIVLGIKKFKAYLNSDDVVS